MGYLIKGCDEAQFLNARLYNEIPLLKNKDTASTGLEGFTPIRAVKESDLLLLSFEDICFNHHGKPMNDIKKVISPSWLKSNLMKPNVMFAYVKGRANKGQ